MVVRQRWWIGRVALGMEWAGMIMGLMLLILGFMGKLGAMTCLMPFGIYLVVFSAPTLALLYWSMKRPYFVVHKDRVEMPGWVRPRKPKYTFASPEDIQIENGKLMVRMDGRWKRVPVSRWPAHPDDWRAMVKHIQSLKS